MLMKASCKCSNVCAGIIALIFGVLFLLGTTGVWPEFTFAKYWPVILVVIGIHNLLCPCASGDCGCNDECCEPPKAKSVPAAKPSPTKKAPAKKSPAKKAPAKKTTAKKTKKKK